MGRVPELEGVRGLAILLVVAGHAVGLGHAPAVGVTLFFVLSGYLITSNLVGGFQRHGRLRLTDFWIRRARRIVPGFSVFALTLVLIYAAMGRATEGLQLVVLAPVMDYWEASGRETAMTQHLWSLAVEEQFYLVWPAVALLLWRRRRRLLWLAILLLAFASWRMGLLAWGHVRWAYYSLDGSAFALLAGCLAGMAGWRPGSSWLGWIALAAILALSMSWGSSTAVFALLVPLSLVAIGLLLTAQRMTWLSWAPLRTAGRVSYGWYLWHLPLMVAVADHPAMRWGAAALSLLVAYASWKIIEAPWLNERSRTSLGTWCASVRRYASSVRTASTRRACESDRPRGHVGLAWPPGCVGEPVTPYLHVRTEQAMVNSKAVVATGVTEQGRREILGLEVGGSEDEVFWRGFLTSLKRRGLTGVKLVISDQHAGLVAAIGRALPGSSHQRCRVHFIRNVLAHVAKGESEMVAAVFRTIFAQPKLEPMSKQ